MSSNPPPRNVTRAPSPGGRRIHHAEAQVATGDALDVRQFRAVERMSALFEVQIRAVSANPDLDFERIVGHPMRFAAHGADTRAFAGLCSHLRQVRVEEHHLSTYELTLVPSMWLLTQRRNHRMFQHRTEIEIARQILGEWGITPRLQLAGTYRKRKYRVQYGETDFAFVCRLLEDAGVSFYFDNGGQSELVLDDGPQANAARPPIAFRDQPSDADLEHVTGVVVERRVRPGRYTVRDHDYRRPAGYKLMSTAAAPDPVEERLESFHYVPGAFLYESPRGDDTPHADDKGKYRADEAEGEALARRRLEAERAGFREVSFKTNALDPMPGVVLSFLDHPKSELAPSKSLLVLESTLEAEIPGAWRHACVAVGAEVHYRPPHLTPKPRAAGVESATVVGPAGEEIHTDEFGRVRVHFHWN